MLRNNVEENILIRALNKFREETGLIATEIKPRNDNGLREQWDTIIKIEAQEPGHEVYYYVQIKKRVTRETIGPVEYKFRELKEQGLLLTEYMNPDLALELRKKGVQFIDTLGNAYINAFPFYIFVRGNKKLDKQRGYAVGQRAFRKTGLKVIFEFLCNPGFEDEPVRQIAEVADVAVGTVDAVFKNLKEIGFLVDKGKFGRKVLHKDKLLERWVTAYQENVRAKLVIGRYTAKNKYWWEDATLPEWFYWGGEVAAAKLTKYLKPEIITVYTHDTPQKLLIENKLRKEPKGEIEILKAFWGKNKKKEYHDKVHPLLIYADLLAVGDERDLEAAKIIFENDLDRLIRTH